MPSSSSNEKYEEKKIKKNFNNSISPNYCETLTTKEEIIQRETNPQIINKKTLFKIEVVQFKIILKKNLRH